MIIGIDLGGTTVTLGQLKDNKLIQRISAPSPSDKSLTESIQILKDLIQMLINPEVKGIGIGVPSVVDKDLGIVYNVANIPSWKEVHLKKILEDEFNIPIFVNNDSNCFTLGEKTFGVGKHYHNIVGVTLGTGVGAGVIVDNKLYSGANTGVGEVGAISYLDGIYEDYCASAFFEKYYKTTGKDLFCKAECGDPDSLRAWDEYGKHLANLIQVILFTYDPQIIILGGSITNAYKFFKESMIDNLQNFPYPEIIKKLKIEISRDPDIALLGAVSLVEI